MVEKGGKRKIERPKKSYMEKISSETVPLFNAIIYIFFLNCCLTMSSMLATFTSNDADRYLKQV